MFYCLSLFLLALVVGHTHAFTVRPTCSSGIVQKSQFCGARPATSMRYQDEQALAQELNSVDEETLWRLHLQSDEIQKVRRELVQKVLQTGKPKAIAVHEVDDFLGDRTRSEPFLEMRLQAHEELKEGELDPLLWFQLFGAFFVGFLASAIPKYYSLYKESFPDGNGPLLFP